MPGDVLIFHGLNALSGDTTMDYGYALDGYGAFSSVGSFLPSRAEAMSAVQSGGALAVGIGGMLLVERIIKRQFNLSSKVMPVVHLVGGIALGKMVGMWINPLIGGAITAAGAALSVIRGLQSWVGYKMDFSGLGAFDDDDDLYGLDGFDAIEVEYEGLDTVIPEMAM